MPGMTGSETFRALTAMRPDLPVVVCTGYAADSHIDTDVKRRIAGLVQKPFTAERLAAALEAAGALPTRPARSLTTNRLALRWPTTRKPRRSGAFRCAREAS